MIETVETASRRVDEGFHARREGDSREPPRLFRSLAPRVDVRPRASERRLGADTARQELEGQSRPGLRLAVRELREASRRGAARARDAEASRLLRLDRSGGTARERFRLDAVAGDQREVRVRHGAPHGAGGDARGGQDALQIIARRARGERRVTGRVGEIASVFERKF